MTKDTAFVPYRDEELKARRASRWTGWLFNDAPIAVLTLLVARQTLGWPLYFIFYLGAGRDTLQRSKKRNWWKMSHYDPAGLIYQPHEAKAVILSDIGIILALAGLYRWSMISGAGQVFYVYGVPYLWVNHWMDEATNSMIPLLGQYYHYETAPLISSLWKTFNTCQSVNETGNTSGFVAGTLHWITS
ncbi:hypothetical protein N7491_009675 [Penicillium cf. griseofulvum]|nr:hypothetical protein N7491_009675 [Penicillium cf. griseofulvum]